MQAIEDKYVYIRYVVGFKLFFENEIN